MKSYRKYDNNKRLNEMEYFYDEQVERLDYQKQEKIYFSDMICQSLDMLHPSTPVF